MYKIIDGCKVGPRQTWYEDETYAITYEEIEGQIYVHANLEQVSKSVIEDLKEKWAAFKERLYWLGYENVFTYTRDKRVPEIVGGELIGEVKGGVKVYRWVLN